MAQQMEVAGTERTALGKAAQGFLDKKRDIESENKSWNYAARRSSKR